MERLGRFEEYRFVGDKRTQVVHDIDHAPDEEADAIAELAASEAYTCFGPDTLAEARNRGYRLCRVCRRARRAAGADEAEAAGEAA
ncbi:MAG TPA: hypothetical protein VE575_14810 [Acidimicrobiales bacterium]|jgi:hypothetical protein|nr:hypothetical protein [Acidimicrobiales bacterium]